jgi:hypothetical protein
VAQDQKVEFLFAAQVSGNEQLKALTQSVDKLRKEMDALKTANAGVAASTDAVVRNGSRLNTAMDTQAKAMRNSRMGTQQLGMQLNDFATSVSTGASPLQAFNQQIGQAGYAMSMMGGTLGTVGRFLAGPWGAAILVGTMLLGQFKGKTEESEDATASFGDYAIATFQSVGESIANGLTPAVEAIQPALTALEPVIDSVGIFFTNLGVVGEKVANGLIQTFVIAINSISILASNSFGMVAELVVGTINVGIRAVNSLIAMVENSINKIGGYVNQVSDIFSLGFRVGEANFGRLETITNKWAGTSKKAAAEVGAAYQKALGTDFIDGADISKRADARAAQRAADNIKKKGGGAKGDTGGSADKAKKEKADFSLLGFYEEFFAKEFQQNDESLAKIAEDQINSLLSTVPEMAKMSDEMEAIISRNEELNNSFDAIGNSVSESFKGMLTGAMSFKDAMKGIIGAVIEELWKLFVVQQIVGVVKSAMGSVFGVPTLPGKAIGGSVGKNKPYMVGEQGPELFIPGGSGTIIPNRNLSSSGGGNFNISVDARGASDPAAVRAQVQQGIMEAAPAIIAAAESRTVAGLRRPRLGGVMQ